MYRSIDAAAGPSRPKWAAQHEISCDVIKNPKDANGNNSATMGNFKWTAVTNQEASIFLANNRLDKVGPHQYQSRK